VASRKLPGAPPTAVRVRADEIIPATRRARRARRARKPMIDFNKMDLREQRHIPRDRFLRGERADKPVPRAKNKHRDGSCEQARRRFHNTQARGSVRVCQTGRRVTVGNLTCNAGPRRDCIAKVGFRGKYPFDCPLQARQGQGRGLSCRYANPGRWRQRVSLALSSTFQDYRVGAEESPTGLGERHVIPVAPPRHGKGPARPK
jgi:hypothetical protein